MPKFGKSIGYFKPSLFSVGERRRSGLRFIAYSERKDWTDFEINIVTIGARRCSRERFQQRVDQYAERNGERPPYYERQLMRKPEPVTVLAFNMEDERSDSLIAELERKFEFRKYGNSSFQILADSDQIATHIENLICNE